MVVLTFTAPACDCRSTSRYGVWLTTGCCGRVKTCYPLFRVQVWRDGSCFLVGRKDSGDLFAHLKRTEDYRTLRVCVNIPSS